MTREKELKEYIDNIVSLFRKGEESEGLAMLQEVKARLDQVEQLGARSAVNGHTASPEDLGGKVTGELKDWLRGVGGVRGVPVGISQRILDDTLVQKALTLPSTAALRQPYRTGIVDAQITYEELLGVVPLLQTIPVNTDVAEYVVETISHADNQLPAIAREFTSTPKPELDATFTLKQAQIHTIAGYMAVSRQSLEDTPQLEALINAHLLYKLAYSLEKYVLHYSATGWSGFLTSAAGLTTVNSTGPNNNLDALVNAFAVIYTDGGVAPTAIILHPVDYYRLLTFKDTQGRYILGEPANSEGFRAIFQVPVKQSILLPQGTALVGNFRYAVLFDRQSGSIAVSDQHADFFVRNMVAILAEARVGFGIIRPQAFCKVVFNWGGS